MKKNKKIVIAAAVATITLALIIGVMITLAALGVLRLVKRELTIRSASFETVYSGKTIVIDDNCEIVDGVLTKGDVLTVQMTSVIKDAGTYENGFTVKITDRHGKDVTDAYDLNLIFGELRVKPKPAAFRSGSAEKEYDGKPLTYYKASLTSDPLCEGDTWQAIVTGAQTDVGTSPNFFSVIISDAAGNDVTHNYDVTYTQGTLSVNPVALTFLSGSAEKEYDGEPLTCDDVVLSAGNLMSGHTVSFKVRGKQTEIGFSANNYSVVISDATGKNVTKNYDITDNEGILLVMPINITFLSGSASMVYTGEPLTCEEVAIVDGELLDGHMVVFDVTGEQTEIGESANAYTVSILTEDGNDVTDLYRISLACGTLTVLAPDGGGGSMEGYYQVLTDTTGWLYLREMNYGSTYNGYNFDDPEAWYGKTTSPMIYAGTAMKNSGAATAHCTVYMPKAQASIIYRIMPYYLTDGAGNETSDVLHMVSRDTSYSYTYVPYEYNGGTVQGRLNGTTSTEEKQYRNWVYANYLDVPDSTAQVFRQLAAENGLSANSPTIVDDVVTYISHAATYNLKYEAEPKNVDRAVYFLTESKEGICQHYAVAATLMFRVLGIPARYVQGYLVHAEAYEMTKVTGDMGHAWTEIYVNGIGWMQVDATASGDDSELQSPDDEQPQDKQEEQDDEKQQESDFPNDPSPMDEKEKQKNAMRAMLTLSVKTNSVSKTYDGTPCDGLTCDFTGELLAGDYFDGFASDETIGVGVHPNQTMPIIRDAWGNDVTFFYTNISWNCGTLTILPAELTIQAGSASKPYDGTDLQCTNYSIVAGKLMPGDVIVIDGSTKLLERGSVSNCLNIQIIRGDVNVTNNYALQQIYGTLTVSQ